MFYEYIPKIQRADHALHLGVGHTMVSKTGDQA